MRRHDLGTCAGLRRRADFTSNASVQVVQMLQRPPDAPAPEVTPEVRLVQVLVGEMTRQQLQQALGLKDDDHFRKAYLQPALDAGLIEMTVPDKPRSSRQKYRLPAGHGDRKGTYGTQRDPGDTEAGSA